MTISLPGGYSISFTLKVSGGPVKAVAFPTYSGAYLGNGAYTGVAGKPALYQTQSGTTTTAALSNISVVDSQGNPVTGYSFVGADAESTDTTESITWTSDQALSLISNIGNACNSGALLDRSGHHDGQVLVHPNVDQDRDRHPRCRAPLDVLSGHGRARASRPWPLASWSRLFSSTRRWSAGSTRATPSPSVCRPPPVRSSARPTPGPPDTRHDGAGHGADGAAGENYTLSEAATSGLLSNYDTLVVLHP